MDLLLKEQGMEVLHQLLLEDLPQVLATIKTKRRMFTTSFKEQAVVMESDLTWTSTTVNHPSFTILICTDSKSPKHSCHRNLSHLSFMNPLFPFLHPFTFSGLRDIMTFQTMD